jgi:DNA polymerase-3 subunit beta
VVYKRTDVTSDEPVEFIMPKKPLSIFKNILSSSNDDVLIEFNENINLLSEKTFGFVD